MANGEPHPPAATPRRTGRARRAPEPSPFQTPATLLACAICLVVHLAPLLGTAESADGFYAPWGYLPAWELWGTHGYWVLLTSVFVHVAVWHVAFNVYWLWVLGRKLERAVGTMRWIALFVGSAVVSSAAELAWSEDTGVGASGVVYAMAGYVWVAGSYREDLRHALTPRDALWFGGWLVGCIVATAAEVWQVGNAAHVVGLLFGAGIAAIPSASGRLRPLAVAVPATVLLAIVTVSWSPWSQVRAQRLAYDAHAAGQLERARDLYGRAIALDPDDAWSLHNRGRVFAELGDDRSALVDLDRAMALSPEDPELCTDRADLHCRNGEWAEARDDLTAALGLAPDAGLFYRRAWVWLQLGDDEAAIGDCLEGAALYPRAGDLLALAGSLQLRRGQREAAFATFDRYVAAAARDPDAYAARGHARYADGAFAGALEDFQRAAELGSGFGEAQLYVFLLRARLGERERAAAELRQELEASTDADRWAWFPAIARFLLGDSTESEFLATMTTAEAGEWPELKSLLGRFYAGTRRLLDGDSAGALQAYDLGVALGVEDSHEHWSSRAEARRLRK